MSTPMPATNQGAKPKRVTLVVKPGQSFTVKRGEARAQENAYLSELFCEWFGKLTNKKLRADNLLEDLKDGTVLCSVVSRIPGSGLTKYHNPAKNEFQGKENLLIFSKLTTTQLHFPTSCGDRDFDENNLGKVLACLLYVAKVADQSKVLELTESLPEGLRERAEQEPDIVVPIEVSKEEAARKLSYFEQIKFWIDESVQSGLTTVRGVGESVGSSVRGVGEMVTGKAAVPEPAEAVPAAAEPPAAAAQ